MSRIIDAIKGLLLNKRKGLGETIGLRGELEIVLFDKYGNVKDRRHLKNLIVNVGKAQVAGLINGSATGTFQYIAIGTGTTAPAATDTALQNETHRALADTIDRVTTSVTNDTARLSKLFSGYSGSESITESGVFNASTGGIMLNRQTFAAVNVNWGAGDNVLFTWKIQVS